MGCLREASPLFYIKTSPSLNLREGDKGGGSPKPKIKAFCRYQSMQKSFEAARF
jgi:hypothetical protein